MQFNDLITKHYANVEKIQSIEHLIRRTSYLFVNSHPLVDFARPVPEKIKFIGGITGEQKTDHRAPKLKSKVIESNQNYVYFISTL